MRKSIKIVTLLALLALVMCPLYSSAQAESSDFAEYVASTAWVASIAQMAGIDNVDVIAPLNLVHPPEYEITPMDIVKISYADHIFHAGYEKMVQVMADAASIDSSKMQKVKTTNTEANLTNMVTMLSVLAGTEKIAEERFGKYLTLIEQSRQFIMDSKLNEIPVFANVNQAEFARDLGLNVVETFGGGSLTSEQIALAAREQYPIVIDNYHNPVAGILTQVCPDTKIFVWKNFPESLEEDALYNVLKTNIDMLIDYLK